MLSTAELSSDKFIMRISRFLGDPYFRDNACRRHGQVVCQHVRLIIWWPESSSDHQLNLFPASLRMKSLVMLINSHLVASHQLFCFVCFFNSVLFYPDYMLKNFLSGVTVIYLAGVPKFSSTQFHFFFISLYLRAIFYKQC